MCVVCMYMYIGFECKRLKVRPCLGVIPFISRKKTKYMQGMQCETIGGVPLNFCMLNI